MRTVLALLALLALAPACSEEPAPGQPVDERPRGERCDEMQTCGRLECAAEIQAVRDCNLDDLGCGADLARWSAAQEALAACIEGSGCDETSCDLVGAFTDWDASGLDAGAAGIEPYCESSDDAEVVRLARLSLFTTDTVAECQALE